MEDGARRLIASLEASDAENEDGLGDAEPTADEAPSTTSEPAAQAATSEARTWAGHVSATLDVMKSVEFTMRMPEDLEPNVESNGEYRVFTWTFADGSKIEASFVPAEQVGAGLVLYSVDLRE